MSKNRFIVFSGDHYYPPTNGIRAAAPTLEEAITKISKRSRWEDEPDGTGYDSIFVEGYEYGKEWAYIVDTETLQTVFEIDA